MNTLPCLYEKNVCNSLADEKLKHQRVMYMNGILKRMHLCV